MHALYSHLGQSTDFLECAVKVSQQMGQSVDDGLVRVDMAVDDFWRGESGNFFDLMSMQQDARDIDGCQQKEENSG